MITKLRVQNFRSHRDLVIDFGSQLNIITGLNGSGKTSLVEAIYIALQGKSWRSSFADIKNHNSGDDWWRVDVDFSDTESRTVKFQNGKREFVIGGKSYARLPKSLKLPTILFEPGDLQLLYGSPSRRRDFIDRLADQLYPEHGSTLRRFERVLMQRNNLIKNGASSNELFIWNIQFADLSEKIIENRINLINEINKKISNYYSGVAGNHDTVSIGYSSNKKNKQQIISMLDEEQNTNLPFTKTGPQTHDIKFKINDQVAKTTASRGESRTIIFAVLASMIEITNKKLKKPVYLILDDIDSELDDSRRKMIYETGINDENYIFSTTVESESHNGGKTTKLI